MQKIKKHYEKILLGAVLVVLLGASGFLVYKVGSVKDYLQQLKDNIVNVKPKELKPMDLKEGEVALKRLRAPIEVKLSREHNLFNPVQWQRKSDGTYIKIETGNEVGPGAVAILKLNPLMLTIAYEGASGTGDSLRYQFAVTREADKNASNRRKLPRFVSPGGKCDVFILKDIKGPKEDPTEFVIELLEGNKQVTVGKEKPYSQVSGYSADLKYDPENRSFPGKRQDEKVTFAGDTYNIVAINEREVVLSANSTTKRTTIKYNPAR